MRSAAFLGLASCLVVPAYGQPLMPRDFALAVPQGFGDRHNSRPWSMVWWEKQKKLFVGTGRATACTDVAAIALFRPRIALYPPRDPDIECTPDPRDLPLRAEIWSWSAETDTWKMVFRSPDDLAIPAYPGKFVARDIGFRGMHLFTEPDGTEALYVGGVSSRAFNEESRERYRTDPQLPPPRILRSTDGETFPPIRQDPGTVWHRLHPLDGFRGMTSYKNRLYVIASIGPLGHGYVLEAADPAQGNDGFRKIQVTPDDLTIYELATFNGFLYVGTGGQPLNGDPPFSVWKTDASGTPPYTFTRVIPPGAFRPRRPPGAAISMFAWGERLYVGTERELFRINPDDTWELVVGAPRSTPLGPVAPVSGFDDGFANDRNVHIWRMADHAGQLYVGTLDLNTVLYSAPGVVAPHRPNTGFDLFATADGWHFTRVTRTGFSDLPGVRVLDQGVRTLASTPKGLFVGAANPFRGLNIWRGSGGAPAPAGPQQLEAEAVGDSIVLSWEDPKGDVRYRVFRDTAFSSSREIRVEGPYAVEDTRAVVDRRGRRRGQASYQVVAEDLAGNLSTPSNVAPAPSQARPVDFGEVESALVRWGAPPRWTVELQQARASAETADYEDAGRRLRSLSSSVGQGTCCTPPLWRIPDVQMLLRKLIRRIVLVQLGLLPGPALSPPATRPSKTRATRRP